MKIFLKFLSLITLLIITILLIREFIINYEKNIDTSNKLSRKKIIELLDKGANYNNYYRSFNTQDGFEELYYKDGILVHHINSNINYWMNLNENAKEMILFDNYDKNIAYTVKYFEESNFPTQMTQLGYYSTIYDLSNFNYKYKGIIKFNNRDTYVVETISNDSITNILKSKYYIDKNTGVIVKKIIYNNFFFITFNSTEYDRNIKFDTVTDADILKPDLTKFTIEATTFPALKIY